MKTYPALFLEKKAGCEQSKHDSKYDAKQR